MSKAPVKGLSVLPPILSTLRDEDQLTLKKAGQFEHYAKGHLIARECEVPTRAWVLVSGWCTVSKLGVVVGLTGPGRVFTPGLSRPVPHVTSLRAISPVVAASFDNRTVVEVFLRNPQVLIGLLDLAIQRVHDYQNFLRQMSGDSMEVRLASVLWDVSEPQPGGCRKVPAALTQTVLASYLGVTREEINKKRKLLVASRYLVQTGKDWYLDALTPSLILGDA